MSAALPAEVEARVAAAAAALDLERPTIMELSGGVANRTFRLRDRGHDYVLRLAGDSAAGLGASGTSEVAMQALAADAGLAPPLVLADAARGLRRLAVRGRPHAQPRGTCRTCACCGASVRSSRSCTRSSRRPGLPVVDFGERAAGYLERVAAAAHDAFALRLQRELALRRAALPPPARRVPCHHDLHHRNFLDDGPRLLAVDWEYAGPGDPAADLASCIGYNAIDGRPGRGAASTATAPTARNCGRASPRPAGYSIASGSAGMPRPRSTGSGPIPKNSRGLPRGSAPERLQSDRRFPQDARPMAEITITDRDGGVHRVNAREGVSLMETLREFDYGVAAICGGMCSCATCHVYVAEPWLDQLPPMQGDEKEILQELESFRPRGSRLSCQVPFEPPLAGLEVEIAPEE